MPEQVSYPQVQTALRQLGKLDAFLVEEGLGLKRKSPLGPLEPEQTKHRLP